MDKANIFLDTYHRVDKAHRKYFQMKFAKYGFTPNEILVILFLYNNAPNIDTATDIAHLKGVSKGIIARSVESLRQKNYLETIRDTKDRRIIHLRLKDEHNQLAARIKDAQKDFLKIIEEGISREELQHTINTLSKLFKNAEKITDRRDLSEYKSEIKGS